MEANRALLLEKLRDVRGKERSGRFHCVLALAKGGEVVRVFHGTIEGVITPAERGTGGFGYDSLFVPEGACRTFAEMSGAQKHALSHRGRALAALAAYLTRGAEATA
jgi:XTP/dITP diphosphohydrolase